MLTSVYILFATSIPLEHGHLIYLEKHIVCIECAT